MRVTRRLPLVAGAIGGLFLLEIGFRVLEGPLQIDREQLALFRRYIASDGRAGLFVPHPYTLYTRPPHENGVNSHGFLAQEFERQKRTGTVRIACVGSSTTEGGNEIGQLGSYPHFLGGILKERTRQEVEVLNFGMSGWSSAETLVNYMLLVQDFAPDLVLIHEAVNDAEPRVWPGFREDYSHYYQPWKGLGLSCGYRMLVRWSDIFAYAELGRNPEFGDAAPVTIDTAEIYLFSAGTLPPGTASAFRRNIRTIVEHVRARGGDPVLITMPYDISLVGQGWAIFRAALDEHNAILRGLAREQGAVLVDLDAQAREGFDKVKPFFSDLVHMTSQGNRWKAESIAQALLEHKLL